MCNDVYCEARLGFGKAKLTIHANQHALVGPANAGTIRTLKIVISGTTSVHRCRVAMAKSRANEVSPRYCDNGSRQVGILQTEKTNTANNMIHVNGF